MHIINYSAKNIRQKRNLSIFIYTKENGGARNIKQKSIPLNISRILCFSGAPDRSEKLHNKKQ